MEIFAKFREKNIERIDEEVMSEHFCHSGPYHGNMTFFAHKGSPTTYGYLTGGKDCMNVIQVSEKDAEMLSKALGAVLLESSEYKKDENNMKEEKYSKLCFGISKDEPTGKLRRPKQLYYVGHCSPEFETCVMLNTW